MTQGHYPGRQEFEVRGQTTEDTYDNFGFRNSNFEIFPLCSMPYADLSRNDRHFLNTRQ